MATHRKESMGAADQSIDGVNGFGPKVDVSSCGGGDSDCC
jgi:hypothetical protein